MRICGTAMMPCICALLSAMMLFPLAASTQQYLDPSGRLSVVIVADPYSDTRTGPELVEGPGLLLAGGIQELLEDMDCRLVHATTVQMPPELEREYGEWNRASLTNRTLGKIIYESDQGEHFFIGLLSGSKSLVGMLAGLQHLGPDRQPLQDSRGRDILGLPRLGESRPLKVGLVWVSERGDFNTPNTSMEGDMGGMNVAVAAGLSNSMLRQQAGLDPPISTKHIVMAGVQDTTPYEQLNIDNSFIEAVSVGEMKNLSAAIEKQMERLSNLTDVIYVHVDLSILTAAEMPDLPALPHDGLSSDQLAAFLRTVFSFPKATAIGIAGLPNDADEVSIRAAYRLIEGAIGGVRNR
ncbi:MAG: arginase family protein [Gemmatimonadota bacterium]